MTSGKGRQAFSITGPAVLTVTNEQTRPTFVDLERDGQAKRRILDGGEAWTVAINPGQVTVHTGDGAAWRVDERND